MPRDKKEIQKEDIMPLDVYIKNRRDGLKKFNKTAPDQILEERRKKFLDVGKFKL